MPIDFRHLCGCSIVRHTQRRGKTQSSFNIVFLSRTRLILQNMNKQNYLNTSWKGSDTAEIQELCRTESRPGKRGIFKPKNSSVSCVKNGRHLLGSLKYFCFQCKGK